MDPSEALECPRCAPRAPAASSYREDGRVRGRPLVPRAHPSGQPLAICESCGGVLLDRAALIAIERWGRDHRARADAAEIARRAWAEERDPIPCPRCQSEMFARRWGIATYVTIDSCIDCGAIWLDTDELEQIEGSQL